MEQERVVLFAGLIFAFAIGVFVLWGPSNLTRKRRRGQVGGLVNLGNSCFLNTLLQAFASCPHVKSWLLRQDKCTRLIQALRTTLQVLNGEHPMILDDPFSPTDVLCLLKTQWNIPPGEQDAHELFIVILSALERDLQLQATPRACSLSDALDGDPREVQSETINLPAKRLSFSERRVSASVTTNYTATISLHKESASPFQGLTTSTLICTKCKFKNVVRCDKFDSLSLPLPVDRGNRHTLLQLLNNFVTAEMVQLNCDNCKRPQADVLKTLSFGKLPGCLCIHIVRTTWLPDGCPSKRLDYVEFPELLSMDHYTYNLRDREGDNGIGSHKHLYELRAVVVHRGDLNQGHFVTYRRSKFSWVLTSDAEVSKCSKREVMESSAYMLFYDRY